MTTDTRTPTPGPGLPGRGEELWRLLRQRETTLGTTITTIGALALTVGIVAIVFAALGVNPGTGLESIIRGSLGSSFNFGQTVMITTMLMLTGLAAAIPFSARLWNIGAEGQLYFGAIGAAGIAIMLAGQSTPVLIVAMIVGGAVLGAAWGAIPGLLRAFLRTNEIITSLMLNYVASLLLTYLIFDSYSYWRDTSTPDAQVFPSGKLLPDAASWPVIELGSLSVPFGLVVALVVAVVAWVLYARTRFGFEAQVIGDSPRAARYAGMRTRRKVLSVMGLSGAIAGIGGASQMGDFRHQLDPRGLDQAGYGYAGIVIAALARYNPFAVVLVAFLLGGLQNAGFALQGSDFPAGLVGILEGLILFSTLGGELFVRYRLRLKRSSHPADEHGAEVHG